MFYKDVYVQDGRLTKDDLLPGRGDMLIGEDPPTDRRGDMLGDIGDPGGNWDFLKRVGNSTKTSSLSVSSKLRLISSLSTLSLSLFGLSSLPLCLSAFVIVMVLGLI